MAMSEAHAVVTVPMPSGHTIAVSRPPDGPLGHRACYPGAPIYPTRAGDHYLAECETRPRKD